MTGQGKQFLINGRFKLQKPQQTLNKLDFSFCIDTTIKKIYLFPIKNTHKRYECLSTSPKNEIERFLVTRSGTGLYLFYWFIFFRGLVFEKSFSVYQLDLRTLSLPAAGTNRVKG